MLSPVPVLCKYSRVPTTITWFTDVQVHPVFAIFTVTGEGVQWIRYMYIIFFIKTTHSHSPADRPFPDNSEFTSDKCVQDSIYETNYNVIKVCANLSRIISDHTPNITIFNHKTDQICQCLLL